LFSGKGRAERERGESDDERCDEQDGSIMKAEMRAVRRVWGRDS